LGDSFTVAVVVHWSLHALVISCSHWYMETLLLLRPDIVARVSFMHAVLVALLAQAEHTIRRCTHGAPQHTLHWQRCHACLAYMQGSAPAHAAATWHGTQQRRQLTI